MPVLIVEDDRTMRDMLEYNIRRAGYETYVAENGTSALQLSEKIKPKIAIIDVMLPDICGLTVCKEIKRRIFPISVIILTALNDEGTQQNAEKNGADNFLAKPFSMSELLSLIKESEKSLKLIRLSNHTGECLSFGEIELNASKLTVTVNGHRLKLSAKEYQLIYFLIKSTGKLLSREQLAKDVWGYDFIGNSRTIDIHVNALRRKIQLHSNEEYIKTVRGFGYLFGAVNEITSEDY